MKKFLLVLGAILVFVVVAAVGAVFYFKSAAQAKLDRTYDIQVEPIPLPFLLNAEERAAFTKVLDKKNAAAAPPTDAAPPATGDEPAEPKTALPSDAAPADPALPAADAAAPEPEPAAAPAPTGKKLEGPEYLAEAQRRALARGKNYLSSRAGCGDCHGADYGGKVIIDEAPMGKWISPNITRNGVTKDYDSEDWVRLIRHGVKPDGHAAIMPCQDFTWFSDQELSDIIVYLKSVAPVDRVMPKSELGPIFAMLIATDQFVLSAETLDHTSPRPKLPPELAPTVELGQHLGTTCVGCHGPKLAGGPIVGGDPSWPPAANLTFHETGLAGYTLADFDKTLTTGINKSGKKLHEAMPIALTKNLKPVEREAMYIYFKGLQPLAIGTK